ncbi:MAG: cellulase N-terminal Ig-like domain-containing protein, partial [Bacteroidia bacterium]|nr:cellulase N-terminal Ig-like domain-containing protein [Bacteroidia bacterium]
MKSRLFLAAALMASLFASPASAQNVKLNDLEYFEDRGVNYLVYSNAYNGMFCDEKTAAVEIILRGVRIATGGGIRLMNTPEQWDIYPTLDSRTVDKDNQTIECVLGYEQYDFVPRIKVTPKDKGVLMSVYVDKPVPESLVGKAGMNMEFFPATYFGKTYLMDGKPDIFPKHPASDTHMSPNSEKITQILGLSTFDDRGRDEFIVAHPISTGHTLVLAPEDDNLRVTFKSDNEINLFDGRNLSPNGTFVVRTFLEGGKTGKVAEWYIETSFDPEWVREPNIGFSQVGYTPAQKKVAVVELDKNDKIPATAKIIRIDADGRRSVALEPKVKEWGVYYNRYNYATVDFSAVKTPGVYCIEYNGFTTNVFPIAENVYGDKWHTTMDVWLPAQMDHMEVKEGYRTWHGRSNMDDALQAPPGYSCMDGYSQPEETFTKYKALEHIPGLSVGAWYDAGDFDIQSGTVIGLTQQFAFLWETFGEDRDQTYIDQKTQFVDMHRPDGVPDVIQQCQHGALNIIAQVENIGFVAQGIVQSHMWQYAHIGDAVTQT